MSEIIMSAGLSLPTNSSTIKMLFAYSAPGAHDAKLANVMLKFEFETAKQAEVARIEGEVRRGETRTSTVPHSHGKPYRLHGHVLSIDVNTPVSVQPRFCTIHSKFELVLRHVQDCWTELHGSALDSGGLELLLAVNSPPGFMRISLVVRTIDYIPHPLEALIEQDAVMDSNDEEAVVASDDKGFSSDDFLLLREHDDYQYTGWSLAEQRETLGMSLAEYRECS